MIKFSYLKKSEFSAYAKQMFDILGGNMTRIAPTGNTLDEDFKIWLSCAGEALQNEARQIILINDKESLVGFFQYSINKDTFFMEEIQFKPDYQGKGIFRELYGFVLQSIKPDLKFVEAYASISNQKSIGILERLGLANIGLNKNGRSYHFKGELAVLVKWYEN